MAPLRVLDVQALAYVIGNMLTSHDLRMQAERAGVHLSHFEADMLAAYASNIQAMLCIGKRVPRHEKPARTAFGYFLGYGPEWGHATVL